ncbi:MAG: BTAD domain-containing putative transcriptional regulator [Caldilineaceae bacterium]
MADTLELALLGNPELRLAGHPLARFRSSKVYALLYYLAVTQRAQPRSVLAGLLWAEIEEYYARRNFNRTLSDLAQYVGDHLLIERQAVTFDLNQPYWLDVAQLEAAAALQPNEQNVDSLATAVNLYRGDFLDGFYVQDAPEFEQWVLGERTRLRAHALQLLHTLADYQAELGNEVRAMDYVRRILQLEPWREEAHRQLMLLLARSGQRSAALAQFELCRQALHSELSVEPDPVTLDLVAQIRAGTFDKATAMPNLVRNKVTHEQLQPAAQPEQPVATQPVNHAPPHNLPGQRTPFVGREQELAEITELLGENDDCRLLTLTGPGGMGKTRLALKAAEQLVAGPVLQQRFGDGIFFVPLENAGDGEGLASAMISVICAECGFSLQMNVSLTDQLAHCLRNKAMLLVLDNFEHLTQEAALLSDLLAAAPKLKLLVTSREALGLQEAWFYPLLGLSFPQNQAVNGVGPEQYDAVRLFVQCARRAQPAFAFENERAAVLRICTLVEGMPLGIELAAVWLRVMSCEQIAQEVARGLDILTARYQNLPARHRSMRVVLEHSWALLNTEEQKAIAQLAIFRGKFRQEAASAITGASLFTLLTLVEKAMVRATSGGYYQLHELTRQFAEEQLDSVRRTTLRNAHATYYAGLLNRHQPHLFTSTFRQIWTEVSGELDNIRHAWQWLIESAGAGHNDLLLPTLLRHMAGVLTTYHVFHSLVLTGQALFDQACQVLEAAGWRNSHIALDGQPSRSAALLKLQISAAQFQMEMGHYRVSWTMAEQTIAASRAFGIDDDLASALVVYGRTQVRRGDYHAAIPALEEALVLAERLPAPGCRGEALINLGVVANSEGRHADAHAYYRRALEFAQSLGYRPWIERILNNLGTLYFRQRDYRQALSAYEESLQMAQEEGDQTYVMINISNIGGVQRVSTQYQASIQSYQRSLGMARSMGMERWIAANLNGLALVYLEVQDFTNAEGVLREALVVGQRSDSTLDLLGSIGLLGHVFAHRGQMEAALKALLFVEQHPSTMARDKVYNQPILTELRSELPPELLTQTATWATGQTTEGVVHWLLSGPPRQ